MPSCQSLPFSPIHNLEKDENGKVLIASFCDESRRGNRFVDVEDEIHRKSIYPVDRYGNTFVTICAVTIYNLILPFGFARNGHFDRRIRPGHWWEFQNRNEQLSLIVFPSR